MSHRHEEDGSIVTDNFTLTAEQINRVNEHFQEQWKAEPRMHTDREIRAGTVVCAMAEQLGWDDGHLFMHISEDDDFNDVAWEIINWATYLAQQQSAQLN